jgi:hypothetical protein
LVFTAQFLKFFSYQRAYLTGTRFTGSSPRAHFLGQWGVEAGSSWIYFTIIVLSQYIKIMMPLLQQEKQVLQVEQESMEDLN